MVFVFGTDGELFVMLCDKDLRKMRDKRTLFVDQRQLKGGTFKRIVLSLEKTDQDSLELIRLAGHRVDQLAYPEPAPKESACMGCFGLIETATMLDGKCIACWRAQVKELLRARGGLVARDERGCHIPLQPWPEPELCPACAANGIDKEVVTKQEQGELMKELREVLANSMKCPRCGRAMYHSRLSGYRCFVC